MRALKKLQRFSGVFAVAAGLAAGVAIRNAIHGESWLILAAVSAGCWAVSFLLRYVPYRIERNSLLRQRAIRLAMRDEMDSIVADMFKPEGEAQR